MVEWGDLSSSTEPTIPSASTDFKLFYLAHKDTQWCQMWHIWHHLCITRAWPLNYIPNVCGSIQGLELICITLNWHNILCSFHNDNSTFSDILYSRHLQKQTLLLLHHTHVPHHKLPSHYPALRLMPYACATPYALYLAFKGSPILCFA